MKGLCRWVIMMSNLRYLSLFLSLGALVLAHESASGLRHWEIASPDPDRIFLSFHGDPASSRAVTWRTDATVAEARAQIAPALAAPRFDRHAVTHEAVTEAIDLNRSTRNAQGVVHQHSVVFDNLKPDTLYAYRVGEADGYWSEWIQFRTAREGPAPFKFLYFGDAQNDVLSHWSRVIRAAAREAPDAAIALHAGDLINRAHTDVEWAEWFKAGGFLHRQWTGIPVTGNHEYDRLNREDEDTSKLLSLQWRAQFTLPVVESLPDELHETVYAVDYQGVRFIVLNSIAEWEAQTPWLEAQLSEAGPQWRIVSFHHPFFSPGKDRDNGELRAIWKPLFDRYGVDLVLQGHDHTYARGQVPVRSAQGFEADTLNTLYVTSVSGPKMYDILDDKFELFRPDGYQHTRQAENTQFFQVISVDGGRLTYEAFTATGALYDRAIITKDFSTGKKTIEQQIPGIPTRTHKNTEPYN
jgi:hypothetical protein